MTRWWNYSEKVEEELISWFKDENLNSWLPFCYEIFIGSSEVKRLTFSVEGGECSWSICYADGWCFPAERHACKTVDDIINGLHVIMKEPKKYRQ